MGILEKPENAKFAAIVLHPHPLYGGDMFNPVVTSLAETFQEFSIATLRFNFRGVSSRSEFAGISGAIDDTIAASQLLKSQGLKLAGVAGYSFGGSTSLRFSSINRVDFVVSVSSSFELIKEGGFPPAHLQKIACPILMFHGTSDLTVPHNNMKQISSFIQGKVSCVSLENEGHFYHYSLKMLHDELSSFMKLQEFPLST
jgi:hypothetical protein